MKKISLLSTALLALSGNVFAQSCEGYGPQTPRDIDNLLGENKRIFSMAPAAENMNLCNIHFHKNAEHKAKDFSIYAGDGKYGGYQCAISARSVKS